MPVRIKGYDCFDENVLIVGMARQGKSVLLDNLITQELDKMPNGKPINFWLFDPRWQHRNPRLGAKIVRDAKDLAEGKFILQPAENAPDQFDKFCQASRAIWNLVIIVEEVQLFCTKMSMPYYWREIVTTGETTAIPISLSHSDPPKFTMRSFQTHITAMSFAFNGSQTRRSWVNG